MIKWIEWVCHAIQSLLNDFKKASGISSEENKDLANWKWQMSEAKVSKSFLVGFVT
jgi:hypothetical protein